jgi:anti-sigma B factor antagonist
VSDVSEEFDAEVVWQRSEAVVVVNGELDLATSPRLAACIDEVADHHAGDVVVDLAGVSFLDSSALRVLVAAHLRLADGDRRLVVRQPSDATRSVLTVAGLLTTLAIETPGH